MEPTTVRAGKKQDFERRIIEQWDALRRFSLSLTKNDADADDLLATSILKAFERFDKLKEPAKFKSWMFTIVHNQFISDFRHKRRLPETHSAKDEAESFSLYEAIAQSDFVEDASPETEFIRRLNRERIEQAVQELPHDFRTALVLSDIEELSYAEIARVTKVPIGTVRSRIARARSILQEKLWQHARELGIRTSKQRRQKSDYTCNCGKEENAPLPLVEISS